MLPIVFGLSSIKVSNDVKNILLLLFGLVLVFIIGFRHEVGGDWDRYISGSYTSILNGADYNFINFLLPGDFLYRSIYWFSVNYLDGIYSTNFICAAIFSAGLIRFCRDIGITWIALFVSIPFLVVVVSMGYTRQSAAIGLILWGLVDLSYGRKKTQFFFLVVIASLFHIASFVAVSILLFYNFSRLSNSKRIYMLLLSLLFIFSFILIFRVQLEHMFYFYVTNQYKYSDGAVVRVLMSFISAIIFFIYRKEFKNKYLDYSIWLFVSMVNIALLPTAYFFSIFADRIAIFFLPLQMVVYSRVPLFIISKNNRTIFIAGIIFVYISALFVWLNFGNHSKEWLPYQNILIVGWY
jgi:hypothetical protein